MRRIFCSAALAPLFLSLVTVASSMFITGCSTVTLAPAEQAMWSTYPVATQKGMGTCFLVESEDPRAPGNNAPVVITCLHVLKTVGKGALYLAARVPDGEGAPSVVVLEARAPEPGKVFYVRHPDHDIAAFRLSIPEKFASSVPLPTYFTKRGIGNHETKPGDDVSFLGFPEILPGTPGVLPILRGARVASYSGAWFRKNEFLIHGDVYPGDSGAPVIAADPKGTPRLAGMIVQRLGPDPKKFVPLAVAVDALAVRQTLDLLHESEKEELGKSADGKLKKLAKLPRARGT